MITDNSTEKSGGILGIVAHHTVHGREQPFRELDLKRIFKLHNAMAGRKDAERFLLAECASDDEIIILIFLDTLRNGSEETVKLYARYITGFINHMGKPFHRVGTLELNGYLHSFRTRRTRNTVLAVLKSFYNTVHALGVIAANPTKLVRLHKIRRIERAAEITVRAVPGEDLGKLKLYMAEKEPLRNLVIIFVLSQMGLRAGEICALDWKDLRHLNKAWLLDIAGKGKKRRMVKVPEKTLHTIAAYLEAEYAAVPERIPAAVLALPMFPARWNKKQRLTRQGVYRLVARACKRAGIDHRSPHDFRHFWASFLHRNGVSLSDIQREAGHESIETTSIYVDAGKILTGASAEVFDRFETF